MIIGVNGKIGSGKDTVGKIIQYLTSECGNSNSSRHRTYTEFLKRGGGSNLRNFDQHYVSDWEVKKFAGKLKQTASLLTGIPVEKFEDQEFKMTNLSDEWSSLQQSGRSKVLLPMTVRTFLQKLGTEAMRDGLHTNVWVNALFADYKGLPYKEWNDGKFNPYPIKREYTEDLQFPNWIITDMRFPNEMEAVKARKGITIRVVRPKVESLVDKMKPYSDLINHGTPMPEEHPSETALDDAEFDYEIINDGTIEDLVEKVKTILIKENII